MQKQALITGGAKRIGKSIALALARSGFDVAIHYNKSKTDAESTGNRIRELGKQCELFRADFASESPVKIMMNKVLTVFPDLSVIINSASHFQKNSITTSSVEDLHKNFAVHLFTPFTIMKLFTTHRKSGVIINILDTKITQNNYSYVGYYLSKKGLAELTKMAALEFAPHFRINGIAPGHVLSPIDGSHVNPDPTTYNPLEKCISLESINETILFLIYNRDITGQIIYIDGGENISWQ